MSGTVLYRKWRPLDFDEVVGQEPVVRTLKNAVAQDKIAHAYLFCGPRGTGKTTTARILARAVNGRTAANEASLLSDGDGLGFDLVEIDAASNRGIDDIRELRERANYQPGSARFKVYLIDEVHQLTSAANDALLKTLEEPPPHVIFILATTDPEELKPTILSRCQRFDFRRVSVDDMVSRLRQIAESEGIAIPDEALRLICREATGSLRDAVNLLDQVWTTCGDQISLEAAQEALGLSPDARALELARAALKRDLAAGLATIGAVQADAIDFQRFKKQVVTHLRHVLLVLTGAAETLALSAPEEERLREVCDGVEASAAVTALRAFSDADVRRDPYQPLPLELALASIVYEPKLSQAPVQAAPASAPTPQRQSQPARQRRSEPQRSSQPRRSSEGPRRQEQSRAPQRSRPETPQRSRQPSPAVGDGNADQLLDALRMALRRRNHGLVATMLNGSCRVVEQSSDALVLGFFPSFQQVHMQKVVEAAKDVSEAASEVLQRRVTVRCVGVDGNDAEPARGSSAGAVAPPPAATGPTANGSAPPPSASAPPPSSAMVQEARRRFGAQPVKG